MSSFLENPYTRGTPEHRLWARWHRAFFDQPVHGQLLAIESQLRCNLRDLLHLNASAAPSEVQREMHARLLEIEESVNLLSESAEHAFVRVVTHRPTNGNRPKH